MQLLVHPEMTPSGRRKLKRYLDCDTYIKWENKMKEIASKEDTILISSQGTETQYRKIIPQERIFETLVMSSDNRPKNSVFENNALQTGIMSQKEFERFFNYVDLNNIPVSKIISNGKWFGNCAEMSPLQIMLSLDKGIFWGYELVDGRYSLTTENMNSLDNYTETGNILEKIEYGYVLKYPFEYYSINFPSERYNKGCEKYQMLASSSFVYDIKRDKIFATRKLLEEVAKKGRNF